MVHRLAAGLGARSIRSSIQLGAKFPKAVAKIVDDADVLLEFYHYPAEHWIHLRTTNPIESTFATVCLRSKVTKGRARVGAHVPALGQRRTQNLGAHAYPTGRVAKQLRSRVSGVRRPRPRRHPGTIHYAGVWHDVR